jgi:hypothetical protein
MRGGWKPIVRLVNHETRSTRQGGDAATKAVFLNPLKVAKQQRTFWAADKALLDLADLLGRGDGTCHAGNRVAGR